MQMRKLKISDDAQKFIASKGLPVRLTLPKEIHACCGHFVMEPMIDFGEPNDKDSYDAVIVNDLTFYVDRNISTQKELKIAVKSLLGFKKLYVANWQVV